MSYNDPYAGQHAQYQYHNGQHNQPGYEFNPYSNQPSQAIPQSPPSSSMAFTPARSGSGHAPGQSLSGPFVPYHDDPNPFEATHRRAESKPDNYVDYTAGENSFKDVKDYRSHYQGNLWSKGSRVGCFGRFFCCTFLIAVYIFLSVVACLALWLRPPSVEIGDPFVNSTSNLQLQNQALVIPLGLNITVNNPTYLSVNIEDLTVDLTYPINNNNPNVGNGTINDVTLSNHAETNFTLPIDLEAGLNQDGAAVLQDIVAKCGSNGGNLNVDANIHIKLKALSVPVSFSISRSLSFGCPAVAQDAIQQISGIIGGLFS